MSSPAVRSRRPPGRIGIVILAVILFTALFLHTGWGIKKELPYYPQIDEPAFVLPAVRMAAGASLNPGFFKHPGSTVIYPLMAMYRLRHFLIDRGAIFGRMPGIDIDFELNSASYYLLGRWLSVFYAVLAIFIVYLLGEKVFGWRSGLLGAWFSAICWLSINHAQLARTDGASVLFSLLSLYLCVRFYQQPGRKYLMMAGAATGLAVATKYSLAPLFGILLLANLFLLRGKRRSRFQVAAGIVCGSAAALLAFSLATPFFLIELKAALADLQEEMRPFHLGADGLSPIGNLIWYAGTAIPKELGWPRLLLAAASAVCILIERNHSRLLLLSYPVIFIAGISWSSLHWARWLIPVLPVISLLAARALIMAGDWIGSGLARGRLLQGIFLAAAILAVSWAPVREIAHKSARQSRPSTKILARKWLEENLPDGVVIAREAYTPDLRGLDCREVYQYRLSYKPLEWYRSVGVQYVLTSSQNYNRYFAEPQRYLQQVSFYRRLFDEGELLVELSPSALRAPGHVFRVYALD